MVHIIGVYFSGTGNTKHCLEQFLSECDSSQGIFSIEEVASISAIDKSDTIVFAYPIYFSNLPKIVYDFINNNQSHFNNKKIFIIATMGLFSGDGTGCSARLFKKYGAEIIGGLHLKMPDCIGDERVLKRTLEENRQIVREADRKVYHAVRQFKNGNSTQEGLNFFYHMAGLFGQRLWFTHKTKRYSDKLIIKSLKCMGCGLCSTICPMNNIELINGKAIGSGKCTMCYRCISNCPKQAITLLGKQIYEQCKIENYIKEVFKMTLRMYQSEDCKEIVELFYNTVHAINKRDYDLAKLDVWAPKDMDSAAWDKSLLQHYSIVCEKDDMIIGFGDMDDLGYLDRLYVHKDYQGCGVASKIVNELENYSKKNHMKYVTTDASITAKPFFEKRGYEVLKEQVVERKGQFLTNFKMKKLL